MGLDGGGRLEPYETEHETGFKGPGWRLLSPSAPYEVNEGGQWFFGYLQQWKLWPDGWYGFIRWGDHHEARWVSRDALRQAEHPKIESRRHRQ